ncbi:MAG: metalloregulator ArsR/SmtB family transcription factor [Firmicutes bacterium]|nr:metalloregulator ArsR/SmtB family transcription factor [Bacillota bacterium]
MTKDVDMCEELCTHEENINQVKNNALVEKEILGLSEIFKALGDPTRIRILYALTQSELCVCDLVDILAMTQSAISHQLRTLRNLRLVKYRKEGKKVFYSLDDEHIINFLTQGLAHIRHN